MEPNKFIETFQPSEYGFNWGEVIEFVKNETNEEWDHSTLAEDIRKNGLREPIAIYDGYVVDGHHRVVAAIIANKPITYNTQPFPLYEGQI